MKKLLLLALFSGTTATFAQTMVVQCHTVCIVSPYKDNKTLIPVFVNALPYAKYTVVDTLTMNGNANLDAVYAAIDYKYHAHPCDAAIVERFAEEPYLITWIKWQKQ